MQRATLSKSDSEAVWYSHNVEQREYLAATVCENPGNDCCYSLYFDIALSFGSQDYYNKSLMTILGLTCVLFCDHEQT